MKDRVEPMMSRLLSVSATSVALALMPLAADSAIVSSQGSIVFTESPFPPRSDDLVFGFDEQSAVAFVNSQELDVGMIAPGTPVSSHYFQFAPESRTADVGQGRVEFDQPVLGVIFRTEGLEADLALDVSGTSDSYFGLESSLGRYARGEDPGARGLGSADDDLIIIIGSTILEINSLDIPVGGNIDGFRVLTAVPLPGAVWLLGSALFLIGARLRRRQV